MEASKVIGESITKSNNAEQGISEAFVKLTGRKPNDKELQILLELQQKEYAKFSQIEGKGVGWLKSGEYEIDNTIDVDLIAANAVVASVIMNSDASITKR